MNDATTTDLYLAWTVFYDVYKCAIEQASLEADREFIRLEKSIGGEYAKMLNARDGHSEVGTRTIWRVRLDAPETPIVHSASLTVLEIVGEVIGCLRAAEIASGEARHKAATTALVKIETLAGGRTKFEVRAAIDSVTPWHFRMQAERLTS